MLKRGDAVAMPKPGRVTSHLWIILTDLDGDGKVVIVNVTSLRPDTADKTTVLRAGDHPFIKHDSVVYYADARFADANQIEAGLGMNSPLFVQHPSCSELLIKRISEGLLTSEFTPNGIVAYCQKLWS